jgi:preprotein translocase subunit SecG
MKEFFYLLQILISLFLIVSILIQKPRRSFGPYFKRRGFEKIVFFLSIFFAVCFILLAILNWLI